MAHFLQSFWSLGANVRPMCQMFIQVGGLAQIMTPDGRFAGFHKGQFKRTLQVVCKFCKLVQYFALKLHKWHLLARIKYVPKIHFKQQSQLNSTGSSQGFSRFKWLAKRTHLIQCKLIESPIVNIFCSSFRQFYMHHLLANQRFKSTNPI